LLGSRRLALGAHYISDGFDEASPALIIERTEVIAQLLTAGRRRGTRLARRSPWSARTCRLVTRRSEAASIDARTVWRSPRRPRPSCPDILKANDCSYTLALSEWRAPRSHVVRLARIRNYPTCGRFPDPRRCRATRFHATSSVRDGVRSWGFRVVRVSSSRVFLPAPCGARSLRQYRCRAR
jgi:hypothetical protein